MSDAVNILVACKAVMSCFYLEFWTCCNHMIAAFVSHIYFVKIRIMGMPIKRLKQRKKMKIKHTGFNCVWSVVFAISICYNYKPPFACWWVALDFSFFFFSRQTPTQPAARAVPRLLLCQSGSLDEPIRCVGFGWTEPERSEHRWMSVAFPRLMRLGCRGNGQAAGVVSP